MMPGIGWKNVFALFVTIIFGSAVVGCSESQFVGTSKLGKRALGPDQGTGNALPAQVLSEIIVRPSCRIIASTYTVLANEPADLRIEQDSGDSATFYRMVSGSTVIATSANHQIKPTSQITVEGFAANGGGEAPCGSVTISVSSPDQPVDPKVVCNISSDVASVNSGDNVRFTINQTAGNAASSFRIMNNETQIGTTASVTFQPTSTMTATAFASNTSGESSCGSLTVELNAPIIVAPTCTISANQNAVNAGESVTLTITEQSGDPATGHRMFSGGNQLTSSAQYTMSITESKTIEGFSSNAAGETSCGSVTVNVNPATVPPDPTVVCSISTNKAIITRGESVRISITQTGGSPAVGFKVLANRAEISVASTVDYTPTVNFTAEGSARYLNSSTYSSCGSVNVEVQQIPLPDCSVSLSNSIVAASGGTSTVTLLPAVNAVVASKQLFRIEASGARTPIADGLQQITRNTTFVGTVTNLMGSKECTATVSLAPPLQYACQFRASATTVLLGKAVTLSISPTVGSLPLILSTFSCESNIYKTTSSPANNTFVPSRSFTMTATGQFSGSSIFNCSPKSITVQVLNPRVQLTVGNTPNKVMPSLVPSVTATTGQTQTILKHHNTPITLAWSSADVTSCAVGPNVGAPAATLLNGSATIADAAFSGNKTFQIVCQSAFGPRSAYVTVVFPGRWYNAYRQNCPAFCSGQSATNVGSPFPEEFDSACASGEIWRPALLNIGVLTFPAGRWGGGDGFGRSVGDRCYRPGGKQDGDNTDYTVGCFCK